MDFRTNSGLQTRGCARVPYRPTASPAPGSTSMQNCLRQEYAYQVISRQQRAAGRSVERRRLPGGEIEVTIAGYW